MFVPSRGKNEKVVPPPRWLSNFAALYRGTAALLFSVSCEFARFNEPSFVSVLGQPPPLINVRVFYRRLYYKVLAEGLMQRYCSPSGFVSILLRRFFRFVIDFAMHRAIAERGHNLLRSCSEDLNSGKIFKLWIRKSVTRCS